MTFQIDVSDALLSLFIFILLLPEIHLLFIFVIKDLYKLANKLIDLLACIYDIMIIIIQNPIILVAFIFYFAISRP
jgi:hypothetical protein